MNGRKRTVQVKFYVTEEERKLIEEKMLISSFGCSYETADIEFGYTLSQARDKPLCL